MVTGIEYNSDHSKVTIVGLKIIDVITKWQQSINEVLPTK